MALYSQSLTVAFVWFMLYSSPSREFNEMRNVYEILSYSAKIYSKVQGNTNQHYAMREVLFVVQGVNKAYQLIKRKINKNKINTGYFFLFFLIPLRNLRLLLHSVLHCLLSMMCLLETALTEKIFCILLLFLQVVCFLGDSSAVPS